MNYEGKYFGHNFEPNECVIFFQSTKIVTQENNAIHYDAPNFIDFLIALTDICLILMI